VHTGHYANIVVQLVLQILDSMEIIPGNLVVEETSLSVLPLRKTRGSDEDAFHNWNP